jgi:hypothetical protein
MVSVRLDLEREVVFLFFYGGIIDLKKVDWFEILFLFIGLPFGWFVEFSSS